ncbi:unnamed protein product [Closterium sp. Naga37s-1]|nr:unnamed protein product [Closterium sp. Naga37s-1]
MVWCDAVAAPPCIRDMYGFAVQPQYVDVYKAYVPVYHDEETERSGRWDSFLGARDLPFLPPSPAPTPAPAADVPSGEGAEEGGGEGRFRSGFREELWAVERVLRGAAAAGAGNAGSSGEGGRSEGDFGGERGGERKGGRGGEVRGEEGGERVGESSGEGSRAGRGEAVGDERGGGVGEGREGGGGKGVGGSVVTEEAWRAELTSLVMGGIPMNMRGEMWQIFVGAGARRQAGVYEALLRDAGREEEHRPNSSLAEITARIHERDAEVACTVQIEKDLPRTFPGHPALDAKGRDALRRLLVAYSRRNRALGYCQGMNFLAGLLLLLMPEENAFWTLTAIVDELFRGYYSDEMVEAQVDQLVFEDLVRQNFPRLAEHMDTMGVQISWITGPWFLSVDLNALLSHAPTHSTLAPTLHTLSPRPCSGAHGHNGGADLMDHGALVPLCLRQRAALGERASQHARMPFFFPSASPLPTSASPCPLCFPPVICTAVLRHALPHMPRPPRHALMLFRTCLSLLDMHCTHAAAVDAGDGRHDVSAAVHGRMLAWHLTPPLPPLPFPCPATLLLSMQETGDMMSALQSMAASTFDSTQLVLSTCLVLPACVGYMDVNEAMLEVRACADGSAHQAPPHDNASVDERREVLKCCRSTRTAVPLRKIFHISSPPGLPPGPAHEAPPNHNAPGGREARVDERREVLKRCRSTCTAKIHAEALAVLQRLAPHSTALGSPLGPSSSKASPLSIPSSFDDSVLPSPSPAARMGRLRAFGDEGERRREGREKKGRKEGRTGGKREGRRAGGGAGGRVNSAGTERATNENGDGDTSGGGLAPGDVSSSSSAFSSPSFTPPDSPLASFKLPSRRPPPVSFPPHTLLHPLPPPLPLTRSSSLSRLSPPAAPSFLICPVQPLQFPSHAPSHPNESTAASAEAGAELTAAGSAEAWTQLALPASVVEALDSMLGGGETEVGREGGETGVKGSQQMVRGTLKWTHGVVPGGRSSLAHLAHMVMLMDLSPTFSPPSSPSSPPTSDFSPPSPGSPSVSLEGDGLFQDDEGTGKEKGRRGERSGGKEQGETEREGKRDKGREKRREEGSRGKEKGRAKEGRGGDAKGGGVVDGWVSESLQSHFRQSQSLSGHQPSAGRGAGHSSKGASSNGDGREWRAAGGRGRGIRPHSLNERRSPGLGMGGGMGMGVGVGVGGGGEGYPPPHHHTDRAGLAAPIRESRSHAAAHSGTGSSAGSGSSFVGGAGAGGGVGGGFGGGSGGGEARVHGRIGRTSSADVWRVAERGAGGRGGGGEEQEERRDGEGLGGVEGGKVGGESRGGRHVRVEVATELQAQVAWLKEQLVFALEARDEAILRAEALQAAMVEMGQSTTNQTLAAKIDELENALIVAQRQIDTHRREIAQQQRAMEAQQEASTRLLLEQQEEAARALVEAVRGKDAEMEREVGALLGALRGKEERMRGEIEELQDKMEERDAEIGRLARRLERAAKDMEDIIAANAQQVETQKNVIEMLAESSRDARQKLAAMEERALAAERMVETFVEASSLEEVQSMVDDMPAVSPGSLDTFYHNNADVPHEPPIPCALNLFRPDLLRLRHQAFALARITSPQFPIPSQYDGLVYGADVSERQPVLLEAFLDLTCPSCQSAWPVLRHVAKFYGTKQLRFVVHLFSNAFHHNSYFASQATNAVAAINGSLAFDWIDGVFDAQDDLSLSATWQKTPEQVAAQLARLASERLGIDEERFKGAFLDAEVEWRTRLAFKYGCSRAVVGTPTFLLNGVAVPIAAAEWTIYEWRALLDPLVAPSVLDSHSHSPRKLALE